MLSAVILIVGVFLGCCSITVSSAMEQEPNEGGDNNNNVGSFLWLSDVHLDLYYGSNMAEVHKSGAPCASNDPPKFSAYGCGSSYDLLVSTINESSATAAASEGGVDFILFTGDSTRHNTQNVLINNVTNVTIIGSIVDDAIRIVYDMISENFPNVPLVELPSLDLGNNDFLGDYQLNITSFEPCVVEEEEGVLTLPNATNEWLITVADKHRYVFIDETEHAVFACGGYMNRLLQDGLRIISLNTIVWSLSHEPKPNSTKELLDPFGEMKWLKVQLENARGNNEKIYITGHVPPMLQSFVGSLGDPLWDERYVDEFFDIVRTYKDVIAGMFFAHVHSNELRAVPQMPDDHPPMMVAGSVGPCYTTTPFYSYVYFDRGETKFPVDVVSYNLDLDTSSKNTTSPTTKTAKWKRMFHNLTSYLGISALTNREVKRFASQMASNSSSSSEDHTDTSNSDDDANDNNNTSFQHYFQNWYKGVPQDCDGYCRKKEACLMTCGFRNSTWEACINDDETICSLSSSSITTITADNDSDDSSVQQTINTTTNNTKEETEDDKISSESSGATRHGAARHYLLYGNSISMVTTYCFIALVSFYAFGLLALFSSIS